MKALAMSACGSNCGITRERERQKDAARALARSLSARGDDGASPWRDGEVDALAEELGGALPCRVCVVEGDTLWIHLVATVDDRAWVATRELGETPPARERETSLRVGLSRHARYATLQETRFTGARDGDGWWIEEDRLAGVDDRRLQTFVKAAQGILRKRKVVCLDAAFLAEPLRDGADETLWEALFDRDPMGTRACAWVASEQLEA
jgi:hypothetical protein